MWVNQVLPLIAGALFILFLIYTAVKADSQIPNGWIVPAFLCAFFLAFSVYAVIAEGPLGFWTEHVRNYWGNQIWLDLLFAASIGWYFAVPEARALGMRPQIWLILITGTGCIGFLAMVSRLLYLREKPQGTAVSA